MCRPIGFETGFRWGASPYGRGYVARLHVPVTGDVVAEARQFPCVRLDSVVTFEQIDGGTRIVERLRIRAPGALAAVTVREAVNAHREMLSGIRRYFE